MFLTQEDYRKIESWLKLHSKKDTDFDFADSIDGTETVTIVQGNKNKRMFLRDFINQVGSFFTKDLVNVTADYGLHGISLETAIHVIPLISRKEGLVITFEDYNGNWHICQFIGSLSQWNLPSMWEDILDWEKHTVNSILPDNEDLTTTEPDANGNAKVKFADKEYNPDSFSGLGHVILRKNLVEINDPETGKSRGVVNYLYQDMIKKENTIYEIKYDFDLNGQTITIPNNCLLQFNGGKLLNGKIHGNLTIIDSPLYNIFDSIIFGGTWKIGACFPEWFGAKANGVVNCSLYVLDTIDSRLSNTILFGEGKYNFSETVNITKSIIISGLGDNSILISNGESIFNINGNSEEHYLILNLAFHSSENASGGAIQLGFNGFCINTTIRDCSFVNLVYGISLHNETDNLHVAGCHFLWCNKAVYSADMNTNKSKITIENNHFLGGSNDGFDIRLESCNNVSICNNLIQASARTNHTAIYIGYTNVSVIKNNYYEISSGSEGLPNKCIVVTMSTDCNVEDIRTQGFMDSVLEINGPNVWDIYVKHLVYGSINGSSIDSLIKNNLGSNLKNKIYLIDATIGSFQKSYISSLNGVDTESFSYSYTSDLYVYKMDSAEIDLTNIFSVSNVIRFVVKIKNVELPVEEYIIDRGRNYTHYIGYEGFGKISYSADTKKLTVVSTSESVPMDLTYGISKMV